MPKLSRTWSLADAKAQLSNVVDRALNAGPQVITRRGHPAVVVVSAEEWARANAPTSPLSDFFWQSPLRSLRIDLERLRDSPRDLDL